MQIACWEGNKNVCEYLIEQGAEIDNKNKYGMTALIVASEEGHIEICEYLLKHEADINHKDGDGMSPLEIA